MNSEQITIRAFRAVDDKLRCARYLMEHLRVLDEIGVTSVVVPEIDWCIDPNVVVVVAEHPTLDMVAGMRLHLSPGTSGLPMERSLAKIDGTVPGRIAGLDLGERAEIAGLWNAHRFAGRGVPLLLISAGVALAGQLGTRTLMCVAAEYVVPWTTRVGFKEIAEIGEKGVFAYPLRDMRSHAMSIRDLTALMDADDRERHRILSLRLHPRQRRSEKPKGRPLEVSYDVWLEGMYIGRNGDPLREHWAA